MPVGVWNLEWLNQNSQRAYPFAEDASRRDISGTIRITDAFLLALYFPVNAGVSVEPELFYVSSLVVSAAGVVLTLAYDDGSGTAITVAEASLGLADHTEFKVYSLVGVGDFADSIGKVVFGRAADIATLPAGEILFNPNGGRLDSDCVRPVLRGLTGVVLVNGDETSEKLTGVLELVAGTNSVWSYTQAPGQPTRIRLNAIDGEGLTASCVCTDDDTLAPPIRRINLVAPTSAGDFTLSGDNCLNILTAGSAALRIQDACSQPCCGATELQVITNDLQLLGEGKTALANQLNFIEGTVTRFAYTVLGSRLNDSPCLGSS